MSVVLDKTGGKKGKVSIPGPRVCQYDSGDGICGCVFEGIGRKKYCPDHDTTEMLNKQNKYKNSKSASFDKDGNNIPPDSVNLYMKHEHKRTMKVSLDCHCCGEPYEVTLIPSMYIYPKYCEKHRNEFQRNRYKKEE